MTDGTSEPYWHTLTPEKALLARVFVDHCREISDEARVESTLPVVTALAFYLQREYNTLLQFFEDAEDQEEQEEGGRDWEQDILEKEFVIKEMLRLAVGLDYSDEIGRRKMWGLAREFPFFLDPLVSVSRPWHLYPFFLWLFFR